MRIDSYHGPVTDELANAVASLTQKDPATVLAIDVARALRSNMVACLWYENGIQKLEAIAAMQCIETLIGEKHGRIAEVHVSSIVTPDQVRELIQFLIGIGLRWGARHITIDCDTSPYGVDRSSLRLLCEGAISEALRADASQLASAYPT